jgi:hypothetical protein
MKNPVPRGPCAAAGVLCLLLLAAPMSAQDLDPRAYARAPVNGTFLSVAWQTGWVPMPTPMK